MNEHRDTVADRIVRYAEIVGREAHPRWSVLRFHFLAAAWEPR